MNKNFDAVQWMRQMRTAIDNEDQGLSWKEKQEKTLELIKHNPAWERLKARIVKPSDTYVRRAS